MDSNAVPVDETVSGEKVKSWSWRRFTLSALIFLLVVILAAFAYLVYDDQFVRKDRFFEGTKISGIDVSNKSRAYARRKVEDKIAEPLLSPLTVNFGKRKWVLQTSDVAKVDVKGMVDEAYRAGWDKGLFERLYVRWMHKPLNVDVKTRFAYDRGKMGSFVSTLAEKINRKPVDAKESFVNYKVKISPSYPGYTLYRKNTYDRIAAALPKGERSLKLNVSVIPPKKTRKDFKHTLFVHLGQNRLYFYTYEKVTKTYRVATGTGGFRTPTGDWHVVEKRLNPTWYNPHEPWSAGMPERIGPGPGNPLGTRALNLDAPGIRIHGTYAGGSIGSYASHGCIRMHISDAEDLWPRVPVGTPVFIRW